MANAQQQQQTTDINVVNSTRKIASCSSSETSILAVHDAIFVGVSHEPVIGTECSPAMDTHCHDNGFGVSDPIDAATMFVSRMHTVSLGTKPIVSPNEHMKLPVGVHSRLSLRARNVFTLAVSRTTAAGAVVTQFRDMC